MATTDWFVDNGARAFPFVSTAFDAPEPDSLALRLPLNAVLDAQVVFGIDIAYDAATYAVQLHSVSRDANELTFRWGLTTPSDGLFSDSDYYIEQTIVVSGVIQEQRTDYSPIADDPACGVATLWEMQITYGALTVDDLDAWIADAETVTSEGAALRLEPGCIQSLYAHYARFIALANAGRTRATADNGDPLTWATAEQPYYTAASCLKGAIRFVDGYNTAIEVNAVANSITLNARVGAGAGAACEDVALTEDDAPPAERATLDGGLRCDEVLRSFNGIGGRAVTMQAGDGVRVEARPESYTLVVTVGVDAVAGCHVIDTADVDSAVCEEAAAECATSSGLAAGNVGIWRCQEGRWLFKRSQCLEGQRPVNPADYGIVCGSDEFPEGTCLGADCEEIP